MSMFFFPLFFKSTFFQIWQEKERFERRPKMLCFESVSVEEEERQNRKQMFAKWEGIISGSWNLGQVFHFNGKNGKSRSLNGMEKEKRDEKG